MRYYCNTCMNPECGTRHGPDKSHTLKKLNTLDHQFEFETVVYNEIHRLIRHNAFLWFRHLRHFSNMAGTPKYIHAVHVLLLLCVFNNEMKKTCQYNKLQTGLYLAKFKQRLLHLSRLCLIHRFLEPLQAHGDSSQSPYPSHTHTGGYEYELNMVNLLNKRCWIPIGARPEGPKFEPQGPRAKVAFPTDDQRFSSIQGTLFSIYGI